MSGEDAPRPVGRDGLSFLETPGVVALPSGRRMLVGGRDGSRVTLELLGGVRVVVDVAEPEWVTLTLHRARGDLDGPPATRPSRAPATVAMDHPGGGLVIRDLPDTAHRTSCGTCPADDRGQFRATVPDGLVTTYVDVLAGLPLDTRPWSVPVGGVRLWRGRVDPAGYALVELFGDDERHWRAGMPVVARVDLGLARGEVGADDPNRPA